MKRRLAIGLLISIPALAAEPWQTWTNCAYVADRHNDGDSFRLTHGTNLMVLRLYAVDCPETTRSLRSRVADQAAHWQTNTEGVVALGAVAAEFTRTNLLAAPFVVTHRATPTLSGGRIYGYVTLADGRDLGNTLLTNRLARPLGFDPLERRR